ncbi:LRC47 protein, partial [Polyodon spathula]|nr:LRC47 protein [Polyodon spathula]
ERGSGALWAEKIEKAEKEKRRELVLQGQLTDKKTQQTGSLDPKIYSLTLLNYLEISQCPSLREIDKGIGNLIHLQSLLLCRNKLAEIPRAVGNLKSLKVLDVSVNELQALPEEISQLCDLNTLNVSCNQIKTLPPGLNKCVKLAIINISKNEISAFPADFFSDDLDLLSTIVANENAIADIGGEISRLSALKNLDLSNNKLTEIPSELADCCKLKEINFRGNKLKDKRLEKMVNGCQTKMMVRVLHVSDSPTAVTVKVTALVKEVRPYIVCCIVRGMNLKSGNALKRFLTAQIKLHDEICEKRTKATIATHDLQLVKGPLLYDARSPKTLKVWHERLSL